MLFLLRPSNCKENTVAQREINPLTPQLVCESSQSQFYLQSITCVWRHRSHTDDQTSFSQRRGSSTALLKHAVFFLVHLWVCDLKHKSSWLGLRRQGRTQNQFRQLTCQFGCSEAPNLTVTPVWLSGDQTWKQIFTASILVGCQHFCKMKNKCEALNSMSSTAECHGHGDWGSFTTDHWFTGVKWFTASITET